MLHIYVVFEYIGKEEGTVKEIKRVSIVGMGALGLLFGGIIADTIGEEAVQFVVNPERERAYRGRKFTINEKEQNVRVLSCESASPADLLIVAVKYTALESALDTMANCIGENTTVISILNGISSEEIIQKRFPDANILNSVAEGMDAMKFGDDLRYTRTGELIIGLRSPAQRPRLEALCRFFDAAGVPYTAAENIKHRMWGKFMLNVGINQTCMAYETTYSGALEQGEAHDTMIAAMREVMALAASEGVHLEEEDLNFYLQILARLSPNGVPSMRQDAMQLRRSEVEMFAGTVIPMCRKAGVPCPANELLYARIQAIEADY